MAVLFSTVMSLIGFIPSAILLAGCVILWRRLRNEGTLLMLIGTSVRIVLHIVQIILSALITPQTGSLDVLIIISNGTAIASVVASLLFALGLLRLARSIACESP